MGREGLFQPVANSFAVQSLRHTGPFIPFDPWNWRDQGPERVKSLENSRTTSRESARKKKALRSNFSVSILHDLRCPQEVPWGLQNSKRTTAPRKLWLMAASQQGWGPHPEKWDGQNMTQLSLDLGAIWEVPKMGGTPIAGWFIVYTGKSQRYGWFGGTSILGNPYMELHVVGLGGLIVVLVLVGPCQPLSAGNLELLVIKPDPSSNFIHRAWNMLRSFMIVHDLLGRFIGILATHLDF